MQRIIILLSAAYLLFIISCAQNGYAQEKRVSPKPKAINELKKNASTFSLKTPSDSISYAIGMTIAKMYAKQGVKAINSASLSQAIQDVLIKNKTLLSEHKAEITILKVTNPTAAKRVQEGFNFLEKNKVKPGIKTTASGLQYEIIREGTGRKPLASDTVEVHYFGTLTDGTEFDSSYKRGEPSSFSLNEVIKGWTEGLQLMSEGAKYRLYIPHGLAYGVKDREPKIGGGSTLIFEVELLKVK